MISLSDHEARAYQARHTIATVENKNEHKKWELVLFCMSAVSSYFLARYLQFGYELIVWACLTTVEFFCARKLYLQRRMPQRGTCIAIVLFALLFNVSIVLGYHIHTGNQYSGLINENYIVPYSWADLFSFFLILPGLIVLMLSPATAIDTPKSPDHYLVNCLGKISWHKVFVLTLVIFAAWIPYLVTYWPGIVLGDSVSSIWQALGFMGYRNHHPVAYTLFLQFWINIAALMGRSHAAGIGLSSITQMLMMSGVFAYMIEWMVIRFRLSKTWYAILTAPYALTTYVATYGVALWKDPLFSVALVVQTICIADFIWSKGNFIRVHKSWHPAYILSGTVLILFRNNGIFVFVASVITIMVMGIHWLRKSSIAWRTALSPVIPALIITAVYLIFTGPIYSYLKVTPTEKVESVGIPLNQMARVAALDGDMSKSDRAYLNTLLPIDEYKNLYRPCCTDLLKWNEHFNGEPLNTDLWRHWSSMLVRNPRVYFEAWELQTFGFWAVNVQDKPGIWNWNISWGAIYNAGKYTVPKECHIHFGPYNTNTTLTHLFPTDEWSIPISWILWVILYLCILFCSKHKFGWLAIIIPSLALLGTLVIASPRCYWPRYGAAVQFLTPVYLLLYYAIASNEKGLCSYSKNDSDVLHSPQE